jgi:hypothetical protein
MTAARLNAAFQEAGDHGDDAAAAAQVAAEAAGEAAAGAAEDAAGAYTDAAIDALGFPRVMWADDSVVCTFNPLNVSTSVNSQTANQIRLQRVVIQKTGTLHDLAVFVGTASGNVEVAVYDTQATLARLYSSGSVAAAGANAWQIVGDPNLAVTKGQHVFLGFGADNATVTIARQNGNMAAVGLGQMPWDLPGALGSNRKTTTGATSSFPAPATIADGTHTNQAAPTLIIGRIS